MPDHRVPLRTYADVTRAEMDRVYLERQGVSATLSDGNAASAGGPILTANGTVRVEVPFAQREHAIVLLEQRRRLAESRERNDDDERCPRCAQEDISTYQPVGTLVALMLFLPVIILLALVLIPFLPRLWRRWRRTHWYCASCGHRWTDAPAAK